ncbi:MAG TPA: adenylate/guanylate cyclase domain-containing protein [Burkholderiales bacterium]|nr:adenylate/guanylate cyclase domain-containing protein [Burkholderiales bacterium]
MLDRGNRTFICSVVFADIVEYSKKPVADQMKLKDEFNALISDAIKEVAAGDRIILDTGDGVAISFLGAPEEALFVAINLRDALASDQTSGDLNARIGINLGPVRVVKDINGQPNIIGDGINVAQRVMSFAQPGEVLVSRSYYEVVSHLSQEYSLLFEYQGARADKHVREHEVYAVGSPGKEIKLWSGPSAVKVHGESTSRGTDSAAFPEAIWHKATSGKKILYAGLSLVALVALALTLRGGNGGTATSESKAGPENNPEQAAEPQSPEPTGHASAPAEPEMVQPIAPPRETKHEGSKNLSTHKKKTRKLAEAAPTATMPASPAAQIALVIDPWGEVYLDGKKMGVSPPLKELEVKPGKHTVEIKNTTFASHTETLDVKSNDHLKITHEFR